MDRVVSLLVTIKNFVHKGLSALAFGPSVEGVLKICSNGSALLNKMALMPIYAGFSLLNETRDFILKTTD